jgi:hypothetical protein
MILTHETFKNWVVEMKGAMICTLETATILDMNKTHRETKEPNPFFEKVIHRAIRNGMLNVDYENAVNNRRGQETADGEFMEEFNAEALWGGKGEHVCRGIARHKGTLEEYLVFYPRHDEKGDPTTKDIGYFLVDEITKEETVIEKEVLLPYLKAKGVNKRQQVDRPVPWRTFKLDSLVSITVGGEKHLIVKDRE